MPVVERPPAFQFYAQRWLSSTAQMTLEAQGAYVRLLAWSWDNGPLPTNLDKRARLVGLTRARFNRLWLEFGSKWEDAPGGLINPKLEQVRSEKQAFHQAKSNAGKASAAKRQQDRQQTGQQTGNSAATGLATDGATKSNPPISDLHSPKIKTQDPRSADLALADVERQIKAALHARLDVAPQESIGELAEIAKTTAAKCGASGYNSRDIDRLINAVIGTREKRRAG